MKPDGPADFEANSTRSPRGRRGFEICEHMPLLAERSQLWSLVRSLTHGEQRPRYGHLSDADRQIETAADVPTSRRNRSITRRSRRFAGASTPSEAAVAASRAILPEKIYHSNTGVYPGQLPGCWGRSTSRG